MKKQTITAVTTHLFQGALLLALIVVVVHMMPGALAQPMSEEAPVGPLTLLSGPLRLVDTRTGSGFFDAGNHYSNDTLRTYNIVTISGGAVPAGAKAIVARATVVNATASGVLQESSNPPPGGGNDLGRGTAVINFSPANVVSSLGATFASALDANGQIRVHSTIPGTVDVIIDVVGYYP